MSLCVLVRTVLRPSVKAIHLFWEKPGGWSLMLPDLSTTKSVLTFLSEAEVVVLPHSASKPGHAERPPPPVVLDVPPVLEPPRLPEAPVLVAPVVAAPVVPPTDG
jgi:hypothetical protein